MSDYFSLNSLKDFTNISDLFQNHEMSEILLTTSMLVMLSTQATGLERTLISSITALF